VNVLPFLNMLNIMRVGLFFPVAFAALFSVFRSMPILVLSPLWSAVTSAFIADIPRKTCNQKGLHNMLMWTEKCSLHAVCTILKYFYLYLQENCCEKDCSRGRHDSSEGMMTINPAAVVDDWCSTPICKGLIYR
jgi:hypothetical protein